MRQRSRFSRALLAVALFLSLVPAGCREEAKPEPLGKPAAARMPPATQAPAASHEERQAKKEEEKKEPRRDLSRDEARGGHTLARHVGKADSELFDRLRKDKKISAASTYTDRETAERVVGTVISENKDKITAWSLREGRRPNLVLDYPGSPGKVIGRSLKRGHSQPVPCTGAVVVLKWKEDTEVYYVLTSYPEARR